MRRRNREKPGRFLGLALLILGGASILTAAVGGEAPTAAQQHYEAGMAHKKDQAYNAAIQEFREALALHPDYLEAHWALAWTYAAAEQIDAAVREFEEVVRLDPQGEKGAEARKAIARLQAKAPTSTSPMKPPELERIVVLPLVNETGDPALDWLEFGAQDALMIGLTSWQQPSERLIAGKVVLRLLEEGSAEVTDQTAFHIDMARRSQARWVLAGTFRQTGGVLKFHLPWIDGETGQAIGERTVEGTLGGCRRLRLDLQEAVAQLAGDPVTEAERQDRAHFIASNPVAWEAAINGLLAPEPETREAQFDAALRADPDYISVHYAWLILCSTRASPGSVQKHIQELLRLAPQWPPAYYLASAAYADSGQLGPAEELARKGLALAPESPITNYMLGYVFLRQERPQEAEPLFRKTVQLAPAWTEGHLRLGNVLAQQQRWEEARACLEAGVRLNPFHAEARAALADLWVLLGQVEPALTAAQDAVRYNPQSTLAYLALAQAHLFKMTQSKLATRSLYFNRCQEALAQAREWVKYEPQYQLLVDQFATRLEEIKKQLAWME